MVTSTRDAVTEMDRGIDLNRTKKTSWYVGCKAYKTG